MKFLTDSQASAIFVRMVKALGWEVETVYEHGIDKEKDDARLVAWARTFGFVFVSFDMFKKEQGAKVAREIRERGGKVITIAGGPDQPAERALGRLLFHYPEWSPFLEKHDGRVDIRDLRNCKRMPRSKMRGSVKSVQRPQFDEYLQNRADAKLKPIKRARKKSAPREQSHMDFGAA